MSTHLCITIRWLDDRFHGLTEDKSHAEWPPSPFRLLQALVAGACQYGLYDRVLPALKWLERQSAPDVLAVHKPKEGSEFEHYVPDNDNKVVHDKPVVRIFKPLLLEGNAIVHYVWAIQASDAPPHGNLDELASTLGTFGRGIDQAFALVRLANVEEIDAELLGTGALHRFAPVAKSQSTSGTLRTPRLGTLDNLQLVFQLNRIASQTLSERHKKRWPTVFDRVVYSGMITDRQRPHSVFKLVDESDDTVAYSHAKLIHIAGMVRHAAIKLMTRDPPRDLRTFSKEQWLDEYVAGHKLCDDEANGRPHTQFSYVPLPSTGHVHVDADVRRVMIIAPVGDEAWLSHLAQRLDGQTLAPLPGTALPRDTRLQLISDKRRDGVRDAYTRASQTWDSFTPVILPGHDNHKPDKTRRLIEKALAHAGVDKPCEFEWSSFSHFPKSYSAHKYIHDNRAPGGRRPVGYIRPDHLLQQTAVHLQLRFDGIVAGPITVGAGRHCGFGLFAATDAD
jgi:CRISPR-associated protein Csb2